MATITDKKQYPGEQYLNELITNIEFAARAPVEVVRAMAAELQKRREADGAEPVAWVMADDLRDNAIVSTPAYPCLDDAKERTIGSLIALYAAPPVPVIQADVAQAIENLKQKLVECNRYNYCADAVKGVEDACRAAILHGSEPVSQASKSQHTQFEQVADLYEMQFDDGRTCAFHTDAQKAAQWLQACDGNRVQEYVKLERLQNALSGNSPVTPDGWISCSERMPDDKQYVWFFGESRGFAGRDTFEGYYDWSRNKWWAVTDIDYLEPSEVYALGRTSGWNAYRAAMLQAEPVSNSDELPLDYLQGHKDGLEWAAQLAEANHPQTGDWLYDDPIDLARAIRKGPDMPTVQGGNSPVTPDGWISCSERMPEMGERQCYVLAADFKNNYPPNIPNTQVGVYGDWFNDGNPTWDDGDGEDLYLKEVTHWMPLPEPPQEVNRG